MDLEECRRKGFIRRTSVNGELIKSLIEMSEASEKELAVVKLNESNISIYVSVAYDSLREILEAICLSEGYKVTSHVCIGKLLKKLIEEFDYNSFDRFRFIRNSINYYGKKIGLSEGQEIINKIMLIKKNLANMHLKEYL